MAHFRLTEQHTTRSVVCLFSRHLQPSGWHVKTNLGVPSVFPFCDPSGRYLSTLDLGSTWSGRIKPRIIDAWLCWRNQ